MGITLPPSRSIAAMNEELVRVLGRVVWDVSGDLSADLALLRGAVERAEAAGVEGEAAEEDEAAVDARADAVAWAWQELVTAAYLASWSHLLPDRRPGRASLAIPKVRRP